MEGQLGAEEKYPWMVSAPFGKMQIMVPKGPFLHIGKHIESLEFSMNDSPLSIKYTDSYQSVFEKFGVNEFTVKICSKIAMIRVNESIDRLCEYHRLRNEMKNVMGFYANCIVNE